MSSQHIQPFIDVRPDGGHSLFKEFRIRLLLQVLEDLLLDGAVLGQIWNFLLDAHGEIEYAGVEEPHLLGYEIYFVDV